MRREWITFLCGLTAGLSIAWFLARPSGEAHAAPSIVTLSPERTVELPPPPPAPPHSVLREDDLPALRNAVRTRERLRKELADLRDMRRLMRVYGDGVAMPPTISNCVHTVGLEGCPLVAESMATQRFLAECGILDYDLPRHVYAPYDQTETPWANARLTDAQRTALTEVERAFREHFDAVFEAAYVSATGRSRGSAYYKDAFREIVLSDQGHAEAWGAVQGPLVMLGEADRAEFADLPPVARLYAEMSLAGDTYEAALATVLGETEARRLHKLENGWGFSGVSLGDVSAPPHCHEADYPEGY